MLSARIRKSAGAAPAAAARSSDALPEAGFFVEAIQLYAAEIEPRDNADDPAVLDDRHMAMAAILHQSQRLDRQFAWRQGFGVGRHDFGQRGVGRIFAFGEDAVNRVAAGKDADQATLLVGHQHRADPALAHLPTGFDHARIGRQHHRVLVPDNVGYLPHRVAPPSRRRPRPRSPAAAQHNIADAKTPVTMTWINGAARRWL